MVCPGADSQRRKLRSVELFLRTLQTGGDLAAQLEAALSQRRSVPPDYAVGLAKGTNACDICAKGADELKREREGRIKLEEKCAAQSRRIVELEEMLARVG